MARRLSPVGLCVIIAVCILLIFASNRISLSPFTTYSSKNELNQALKLHNHRYHEQFGNPLSDNSLGSDQYRVKYNRLMHPHNTEVRGQFYHYNRKYSGSHETATALTTNNIIYNTSVRIEDILNAQRHRIALRMKDFEFTDEMGDLKALTPETSGRPIQSVILSTWRSGSTFLGDILNAMPGNYYHYEPLLNYDIVQIRGPPQSDTAVETLRQLLKCNYTSLTDYLEYGQNHNYLFSHNVRLWRNCHLYPQFCYDPAFLNGFCRLFPFQSMKVVRLRLSLAESLLSDSALNVKIILLVRDPRGTVQSRKHRDWCPGQPDCDNSEILCKDLVKDFEAAKLLATRYPDRFQAIRYEDLSLDPFKVTKNILSFYGLPFDPAIEEFLDSHTRADIGGVSSTFRDSKTAPFHWMRDLEYDEIAQIQLNCAQAMSLWGYKLAEDEDSLQKNIFNPLLTFPFR